MLKNPSSPRLLKKVQMSRDFAGRRAGYPSAGWVQARGVLTRTLQLRASAPTRQMGLFQQPARPVASLLVSVLLLALSGTLFAAEDGKGDLLALLPRASDLAGWQPEAPPHQVVGEGLFSLINGGAEIFLKAGFSRAVSQAYIQAGQQPIQLEIYEMTGPEAARAVFGQKAKGNGQPVTLGVQGVDGEYYLIFWQDRFFVTVTGPDATPEIRAVMMHLSRAIEARIAERR